MTLLSKKKVGTQHPDQVIILDGNGDQITSFGGGTQYTDGAASPANPVGGTITFNDGGTMTAVSDTSPLPVSATIDTTGLATAAGQTTGNASLATIAGAVSGTEVQVDVLTMPTVQVQSNSANLATQTTAAAIQTSVELIDDTVATLGTTTYTEATTKGLIMGAVRRDADTTLANTTNEITPLQVDENGYLKVEVFDGGGTHTVDAPVGTPVFVRLSDGSSAITTLPVSLASVPSHAVTVASGGIASGAIASGAVASGAFASGSVSDGAMVTIGSKTDAKSTATDATSVSVMQVLKQISASVQAPPSQAVTNAGTFATQATLQAGTALIGQASASAETGTVYNGTTALTPKYAVISASSSGNNTLVAAVTSKKIRVLAYNFIANGAVNAKFQSGASGTDITGLKYCVANSGICAPFNPVGWFETGSGVLLNLNLSGAVAVGGELTYVEV